MGGLVTLPGQTIPKTKRPDRLVRVVTAHQEVTLRNANGEERVWDYHEWVTLSGYRMSVNRLCVADRRILPHNATKWVCNNPKCGAWAIVSDRYIQQALESAEVMGHLLSGPQGLRLSS